jgi:hypothetical protein
MNTSIPKLPVNVYGNIDVRYGLPSGFVHIRGKRLTVTCKAIGIECAPALVGFTQKGFLGTQPEFDGVVVVSEDAQKLQSAIERKEKKRLTPTQKAERHQRRQRKDFEKFSALIQKRFPKMPENDVLTCAEFTTEIGSGRVGRSTTAEDPILAAVVAYIRHQYTNYEDLLEEGLGREESRRIVSTKIQNKVDQWSV